MKVTPALYGHFTHALGNLAGGKVAVVLEVSGFSSHCLVSIKGFIVQFE
jgi:hypothetical protein